VTSSWLPRALEDSRARGFLGPASIETQINHALGFAQCWEDLHTDPPKAFLDLGSGGGLPGLVLLERWGSRSVFVDSMEKRTRFLKEVLAQPEAPLEGEVFNGRAEELAREAVLSGKFDLVTARSFGPPAVTAECAARFLKVGGNLVVSEPPDDSEVGRWNVEILAKLGLKPLGRVRHGAAFQVLTKTMPTPKEYPRGVGIPNKLPLF
jgi:16S rRNA (guanine527-N7)-methyltransferase